MTLHRKGLDLFRSSAKYALLALKYRVFFKGLESSEPQHNFLIWLQTGCQGRPSPLQILHSLAWKGFVPLTALGKGQLLHSPISSPTPGLPTSLPCELRPQAESTWSEEPEEKSEQKDLGGTG